MGIADLIDRGIWVFPVRGRAATLEDAKAPLSFCITHEEIYECGELLGRGSCEEKCRSVGGVYVTWKSKEILEVSRIYASRHHGAWAIWLKRSGLIGIDIDLRKEPAASKYIDALDELICGTGAYVERTASGGRHYIFRADTGYSVYSDANYIEYKYDGYFIVAPSVLSAGGVEYRYEAICGEIPPQASISDARRSVEDAFKRVLGARIRIAVQGTGAAGTHHPPHRQGMFPSISVLEARRILSLAGGDLLVAAAELFRSCGCHGMAEELRRAANGEHVRIRKVMVDTMRIQRTSRFIFLHLAAVAMRILGASEQEAYEALSRISFIDSTEDPVRDSPKSAVENAYRYNTFRLMAYGMCPLCDLIGVDPCPLRDPYTLILSKSKKI